MNVAHRRALWAQRRSDEWLVYVLKLRDGCWYVGETPDLPERLRKHCTGHPRGAAWTRLHRPVELVYVARCRNRADAMRVERQFTMALVAGAGADRVRGSSWTRVDEHACAHPEEFLLVREATT
ncbi:MAG TPA: GIY-YIG nuclease family protein [Gaiellaceae bacterium]|nr:GIY-YIG nuclease family protein [Gaiellaceae bacterium]